MTGETDTFEYGPLALLQAEAEIRWGEATIPPRSGWRIHQIFGHEGSGVPRSCGLVILGSSGSMMGVSYLWRSGWISPKCGNLDEEARAELLSAFKEATTGSRTRVSTRLFEVLGQAEEGFIIGSRASFNAAQTFLKGLPTPGDGSWEDCPQAGSP
jgi:hypothetical protein